MHIVLVGLNHRSAPVELRERFAFARTELPQALTRLRDEVGLAEAAILSTCNRVEIYARVPELNGTLDRLHRFLSERGQMELPGLKERLYSLTEPDSVRHLFVVASGLDSMVLGEAEIVGQVKMAYESAKDSGATGKVLNVLFQRALNTAKAVRTHTSISRGCTSIGSVAVELGGKIFGNLSGASVLLIGAGRIGALTLQRLQERGVREVRVMNRTVSRAEALVQRHEGTAIALDALASELLQADIVISSTSAPGYLLSRLEVAQAMHGRRQRPLCMIDLGVPRNIEPAVSGLDNVYLFNVDDLNGLVAHYHKEREHALIASQAIVDEKVDRFLSWWREEVVLCANL